MVWKPNRRWFRFSLGTLLILVTIISVCAAYLRHEYLVVQERKAFWPQLAGQLESSSPVRAIGVPSDPRAPMPWVRWLLGDPWWPQIIYFPEDDPDGTALERVKRLYPEATIYAIPPTPGFESLEGKYWAI